MCPSNRFVHKTSSIQAAKVSVSSLTSFNGVPPAKKLVKYCLNKTIFTTLKEWLMPDGVPHGQPGVNNRLLQPDCTSRSANTRKSSENPEMVAENGVILREYAYFPRVFSPQRHAIKAS